MGEYSEREVVETQDFASHIRSGCLYKRERRKILRLYKANLVFCFNRLSVALSGCEFWKAGLLICLVIDFIALYSSSFQRSLNQSLFEVQIEFQRSIQSRVKMYLGSLPMLFTKNEILVFNIFLILYSSLRLLRKPEPQVLLV